MSNFFKDNQDLQFTLANLDMAELVGLREENYKNAATCDYAPADLKDALDNYVRVLNVVGEITGENIAPRAEQVDLEGPKLVDGKVIYHPLTV